MSLTGGKRKVNKSLKAWVTFVKKVQKEEKLSYKDAIHRAKQRKDKGEKWMKGGEYTEEEEGETPDENEDLTPSSSDENEDFMPKDSSLEGGRRRRRTMRRTKKSKRSRKSRKSRKSRR